MKRDPALARLSHDHQHGLAAALQLRRATEETAAAALEGWGPSAIADDLAARPDEVEAARELERAAYRRAGLRAADRHGNHLRARLNAGRLSCS